MHIVVNYLLNHRLQWGKPDTLSLLTSVLGGQALIAAENGEQELYPSPEYFKADIPELISIIQNDWPYSSASNTVNVWNARALPADGTLSQFFLKANTPPAIDAQIQMVGVVSRAPPTIPRVPLLSNLAFRHWRTGVSP